MDLLKRLEAVNKARKAAINTEQFRVSAKEHEQFLDTGSAEVPTVRTKKERLFSDRFKGVDFEDRKGGQD
ncbi:conserved hypothetical protein [Vibrio coralliirubri]|uniref:hypothetical protein n=1 Tax=Vibrio coralliirubri TaxID=1516159 RepID=UPI00063825D7|nr:hypothetical protein [Vibrio coralliirubri]CDU05712.1 conserved hypothetical protein [Vibrio coralliirubri]